METHIFNIPTVVSHSYFTLSKDIINLKEKEINYFYSLLYLFRENLLNQSDTVVLVKKENNRKYQLNSEFKNFVVKIELLQFNELGVISNYSYKDLKILLKLLDEIKIKVNSLGKNKNIISKPIKMIDTQSIDSDNILHIKLTDEFLEMIIHTENYFMKVDLNILFNLSGYKSKKLYLLLKDYSKYKNKCIKISEDNLEKLIGKIPTSKVFQKTIDSINKFTDKTDLKIEYPTVRGKKLKEYKFYFTDLIKKEKTKSTTKKTVDEELMKQSEIITDKKIREGKVGKDNKGGYQHKVYENLLKENQSNEKTKDELWLENFVYEKVNTLKESRDINYEKFTYFSMEYKGVVFHIDNDYCFHHPFGMIETENIEETIEKIKKWDKSDEITYDFFEYDTEYLNLNIFKIEL